MRLLRKTISITAQIALSYFMVLSVVTFLAIVTVGVFVILDFLDKTFPLNATEGMVSIGVMLAIVYTWAAIAVVFMFRLMLRGGEWIEWVFCSKPETRMVGIDSHA